MSKVIDREIEEDILKGLKTNMTTGKDFNQYYLPKFEKLESGEYIFVGNAIIKTLKEFNEYKKAYGEIAKHLDGYNNIVAKIYKNALNTLIADGTKYNLGGNAYSLASKLSEGNFTATTVKSNTNETYVNTINYLTKAAYKTKRLKPCSKLNELMRNANVPEKKKETDLCVLPVMTEDGVVLTRNKINNSLEANFETLSLVDANEIKHYLLEKSKLLNPVDERKVQAQIEKLFKDAVSIGEMVQYGQQNEKLVDKLEKLAFDFSDLVGVDLSKYNKILAKNKTKATSATNPTTTPRKSVDVNEILIDGKYSSEPALEDGKIVTKLTPTGKKFTLQIKNDKFLVKNVKEEVDNSFDFDCLERQ